MLLAKCINDWKPNWKARPLMERIKNRLLVFKVYKNDLNIIKQYIVIIKQHIKTPYYSAATAKTKSECAAGKDFL